MPMIPFPYGKGQLTYDFAEAELKQVLISKLEAYVPQAGEEALVDMAMENPIGKTRAKTGLQKTCKPVLSASVAQLPKGHRAGGCHIQRIHPVVHRDLHRIVAAVNGYICQAVTL